MPAFPIWPTVRAAWLDVWHHKKAALMVGWPCVVAVIVLLALDLITKSPTPAGTDPATALVQSFGGNNLLVSMISTPISLCASVLAYGGWVRFIARGEAAWGFAGRNFIPVLLGQIKQLLVVLGVTLVLAVVGGGVFALFRGHAGENLALALIVAIILVAFLVIMVRLSLLAPYTALTERTDLREAFALTHDQGWRIVGLLAAGTLLLVSILAGCFIAALLVGGLLAAIVEVFGLLLVKLGMLAAVSSVAVQAVFIVGVGVLFVLYEIAATLFICGMLTRVYLAIKPLTDVPAAIPNDNPWHI